MTDRLVRHFRYLPAPQAAYAWIRETFRDHVARIPGGPKDASGQSHALIRSLLIGASSAYVAVPRGEPDVWVGWSAALDGRLLFAYVRDDFRREGIGMELVGAVTGAVPVEVAYWTDDVQAMAEHGVPVRYSLDAYRSLLWFVRGPTRSRERRAA